MLQAQGISVEVGGRLVVDSASFTVAARDKVRAARSLESQPKISEAFRKG